MRLAVSNIAWAPEEEPDVARQLESLGVERVEIAPTKIFENPIAVSNPDADSYREFWVNHGIEIRAFQSMLFGRPDLIMFGDAATRSQTLDFLGGFIELAGRLGARNLVFGSPKNRQVPPGMSLEQANDIAVDFFTALGGIAVENNTCFCIEPNPVQYDCNFVTTARAGLDLVNAVGHPGFKLHLDSAGMTLGGDDLGASIVEAAGVLSHFHVSAPQLGAIEDDVVDHAAAAKALAEIGYQGDISIEMRPGNKAETEARLRSAVGIARQYYSGI